MIKEIWKDVPGYSGLYQVSSLGNVRILTRFIRHWPSGSRLLVGRHLIASVHKTKMGKWRVYPSVTLCHPQKGNRRRPVHQIVLETFTGRRPPGYHSRHLDGNPMNNRLNNLCWGTVQQNADDRCRHGTTLVGAKNPSSKLSDQDVKEIRWLLALGFGPSRVTKHFPVSRSQVSFIRDGKRWGHVS